MRIITIVLSFSLAACASKSQKAEAPQFEEMSEGANIQYQFAYEFFQQGDLIRALSAGLKAVELSPRNPDARNLVGLIYFRQMDYAEAESSFKKALELNPKMPEVYNNLGSLYYEQKRYDEAEQALIAALEHPLYLYPERIYNNLGLVYESLGKSDQARDAYEKAIGLRNDYYLPYLNLGHFWLKQKEVKRAKALLKEASRLCPQCAEPRYHLGQAMVSDNQLQEAIKMFKAGYDADPKSYYGQLCRQFLVERGSIKDE